MWRDRIPETDAGTKRGDLMTFPQEPLDYTDRMVADYAGDGVYVINLGHTIELRVGHHENPTDRIELEPHVLDNMLRILQRWGKLPPGYKWVGQP